MKRIIVIITTLYALTGNIQADELEKNFLTPPDSVRPQTWWHWINGNVTKAGITADLEAMQRIGLGGAQAFSVSVGVPAGLVKEVPYFSADWRALMQHAANESSRLGLEFSALCGDGWSGGGGPWIKPDNAMQRVTWSETPISGPAKFADKLAQPTTKLDTYRDIAVLAIPTLPKLPMAHKTVKDKTIELAFGEPVTVRAITLKKGQQEGNLTSCELQASDDGKNFRSIGTFATGWSRMADYPSVTFAFDAMTGMIFRLLLAQAADVNVTLDAEARISRWGLKAGFDQIRDHGGGAPMFDDIGGSPTDKGVALNQVVDLTGHMTSAGRLEWDAPQGQWTILRIGFTPTGAQCAPATEAGRGLECDKLSSRGIETQFDNMLGKLLKQFGPLTGKTFTQAVIDSWEVREQNWTAGFQDEFKKRRGYDPTLWLPVMAGGRIVGSRDQSERFLWDVRRTIADLIAENFFGRLTSLCHQHGIIFQGEPCGRQQYLYDPIVFQKSVDIPMGEFWIGGGPRVDCRSAASAAHLYGKTVIAAESFTEGKGNWTDSPYSMKTLGDLAFCQGINRYVFHRYAQQPWLNLKPGMTMGPYGINLDRGNTWWEPGKAWMTYITRSQYLLRQGQFVADMVYLTGEGSPNYLGWRDELHPALPAGFDYDGCDAEAIQRLFTVQDGRLVTPSGMSYRFLLLPDNAVMTPAVAQRIRDLVRDGALVIGPRPTRSPSLNCYPNCDDEVQTITHEVWGDCDGKNVKAHAFGKGRVFWGMGFDQLANELGLKPDFAFQSPADQMELIYIHRQTKEADLYFVSNQTDADGDALCTFRVTGKQPELWDAATGQIHLPARYVQQDGCTTVQIPFDPRGSWFVVFRNPASPLAVKPTMATLPQTPKNQTVPLQAKNATVTNDFTVCFRAKPAAEIELPKVMQRGIHPMANQNFVLRPEQGAQMFGEGHVAMGISVGRNGAVLWEHGARYLPARIVAHSELADTTDIAVVYQQGKPTLYINGQVAGKTETSPCIVHPGSPVPFKGNLSNFTLIPRALSATEIAEYFTKLQPPPKQNALWIENGKVVSEKMTKALALDTDWDITFPPKSGAPEKIHLAKLMDLSRHSEEGVRHFSGTANYHKTLSLTAEQFKHGKIYLDLGDVQDLAKVIVNGQNLGVLWKQPFRTDITGALKAGDNEIEIRVTNLWVNRMIGDASKRKEAGIIYNNRNAIAKWPTWVSQDAPPADAPVSFATWQHWTANDALLPTGLLGPVKLCMVDQVILH